MASTTVTIPPVRTDRVRVIALVVKKEGTSDAEFSKYWHEVHGPLFAGLEIVKKNIIKYEQLHYSNVFEEAIKATGGSITAFQGLAVFEAESFEKVMEVFSSEEYLSASIPDEANFLDRPKCVLFPATLIPFFDNSAN